MRMVSQQPDVNLSDATEDVLADVGSRHRIAAKTLAQRRYVDMMRKHDVVFAVGPAGTGKTYLAMAMAIAALNRHEVARVVLTRPAVEAGERLGFLPGTMAEKVNPYLRPLYDALDDMMDFEKSTRLVERGVIEVAPLAFMRGRTLNDSFVILDEAQNTTPEQMKMFLTRLGFDSKAVVTGDVTQIDLPPGQAQRPGRGRRGAARRRGHRLHELHRARRGAPPARADDHARLRARRPGAREVREQRRSKRSKPAGEAAEDGGPNDRAPAGAPRSAARRPARRLRALARAAARASSSARAELSIALRRRCGDARAERALPRQAAAHRRAVVLAARRARTRERRGALLGDVVVSVETASTTGAPRAALARRRGGAPADPRRAAPARPRSRARGRGAAHASRGAPALAGAARREPPRAPVLGRRGRARDARRVPASRRRAA